MPAGKESNASHVVIALVLYNKYKKRLPGEQSDRTFAVMRRKTGKSHLENISVTVYFSLFCLFQRFILLHPLIICPTLLSSNLNTFICEC